jgi:hypothetical protein
MQRFLNLFIFTDVLHVSGSSSAHHQEHVTLHTASGIVKQYCCQLLPRGRWKFHVLHGSSWQQYSLTIPEAVFTVMCSWWQEEEPPETCRASVKINKFKKHCIILVVICNYITMHGRMNIKLSCYKFAKAVPLFNYQNTPRKMEFIQRTN